MERVVRRETFEHAPLPWAASKEHPGQILCNDGSLVATIEEDDALPDTRTQACTVEFIVCACNVFYTMYDALRDAIGAAIMMQSRDPKGPEQWVEFEQELKAIKEEIYELYSL